MQETLELSTCGCPQLSPKTPKKHYQEIGAEAIGNQLIIRVEKSQKKSKKINQWDPPCDCEIPEIRRPSNSEGPRLINAGSNNQIIFRMNSKSRVTSDDPNFRADTLSQLEASQDVPYGRIMVYPQLEGGVGQEIQSDHITVGNQNVYMMTIKKKADGKEQKKRNIELEVRYPTLLPRTPTPPPPPPPPAPPAEEVKVIESKEKAKPKNAKKKK